MELVVSAKSGLSESCPKYSMFVHTGRLIPASKQQIQQNSTARMNRECTPEHCSMVKINQQLEFRFHTFLCATSSSIVELTFVKLSL